jgi:glycosyltransferase involved in cell wall biosynthesis
VDALREGAPALFDIALEFLDVPEEAKEVLATRLGLADRDAPARLPSESEARVHEQQPRKVDDIEDGHGDECLLQTATRIPVVSSPGGDGHVGEQDRHQEELLHRAADSKAHSAGLRQHRVSTRGAGGRRARKLEARSLRVLFVTPYLPSPPRFGGQRRLHGLIAGLASSHDVSVLSLVDPSEDHTEANRATQAYCRRVVTVPNHRYAAGPAQKRLQQLGSLLSARSYEWLIHRETNLDAVLKELLAMEHFDVVHFEFPHMAACRPRASALRTDGPAFLLDEHNIEYDVVRQTAAGAGGALRRAYSAINWRKVHVEERRAWAHLDGCTLTSARDQGLLLADAPSTRTAVVPNGVDLDFFQPRVDAEPRQPSTLLFFGAIDYYPNTDAVLHFAREVMPRLSERVPRVSLSIVGRRPPSTVVALRSSVVEVAGAVEDVRPHIERAGIVIVPLRIGGGTRLKILEAMAMGKAIVSTSLGAEGLDVVPERDLLIADEPVEFARQGERLLDDPNLADRLGRSARRLVAARYGGQASVDRLSTFYGEVLLARGTA